MANIAETISKLPATAAAMPSSAKNTVSQTEQDLPGLLKEAPILPATAAMKSSSSVFSENEIDETTTWLMVELCIDQFIKDISKSGENSKCKF
jgi:hypothetical protein